MSEREAMEGTVRWNQFFVQSGVRVPKIFFYDLEDQFPYILMERLDGVDLGFVLDDLSEGSLTDIAREIGQHQKIGVESIKADLFGVATQPEKAPFESWHQVVEASLQRSRKRIEKAGLVDTKLCKMVEDIVQSKRRTLKKPSVAFFYDLTSKNVIVSTSGALSGVVDIDDLCFCDPTYHLALTVVALTGQKIAISILAVL